MSGSLVLFGDSITQGGFAAGGFAAHLANVYVRRLDVLNRGFSGYNTRWALAHIKQAFGWSTTFQASETSSSMPHDLVVIFFGANDASLKAHNARQHVPLLEFQQNLVQMCRWITKYQAPRLVLVTPPPVYEPQRLAFQKERYGAAATQQRPSTFL